MSDSLGDQTGQHADGVQHISSNTAQPEGAASSSDKFQSPLVPDSNNSNLEKSPSQSSGGGMVDTVKSYLGMGGASNSQAAETGQLGTTGESKNAQDETSGSGSGAGVTGAAATAASAVGLGSGNAAAGGGVGSTSSDSAENTSSSTSGGVGGTMEAAKEKVQEATTGKKDSTSGDDDHKPPQPASGQPKKLENPSAIPVAGGERLGEKHWGESKIVPDDPSKRASAAGISSEEGQPTQQTTDNTAKNTGGATGPPGESSNEGSGGSGSGSGSHGSGEEKTKMSDKIKDKLHMGKKE